MREPPPRAHEERRPDDGDRDALGGANAGSQERQRQRHVDEGGGQRLAPRTAPHSKSPRDETQRDPEDQSEEGVLEIHGRNLLRSGKRTHHDGARPAGTVKLEAVAARPLDVDR